MRPCDFHVGSRAVLLALAVCVSACSTVDDSPLEQGEAESQGTGGDGDGDGDGDGESDGADETDEGDTGDGDPGPEQPGGHVEDPASPMTMCEPEAAQGLAIGLRDAQLEAAPELVRARVLTGDGAVPQIPLASTPFFNHFDHGYEPASGWDPQLSGELWSSPMINNAAPPRYHLQYAVRGPAMSPQERLSVDLAVVVDLGSAMSAEAMDLAEDALAALDAALAPGDRVTLIGAGEQPALLGTVVVEGYGLAPLTSLLDQEGLVPAATEAALEAALELAYDGLATPYEGQGQPRVVLISNGHFDAEPLEDRVEEEAHDGRTLIAVGVGDPTLFDEAGMRALAEQGRGPMLFAADAEQLWAELSDQFIANTLVAATDLEVHLTLPPGLTFRQRGPAADPIDELDDEAKLATLGPNDALVFHHEIEACATLEADAVIRVELEWTDPLTQTAKQADWSIPLAEAAEDASLRGQKGAATVAYVRALRSFRDDLAATQDYSRVLDAISLVSGALEAMPEDDDLMEMSLVLARLF